MSLFPAPALKSLNCCVSQMHLEPHKADFLGTLDESSHSLPATSHHTVDPNCGLCFLLVVEPDAQEASANSHCLFKGKAIPGKFPQVHTHHQEPILQSTDLRTCEKPSLKIATDTPMDRQLLTLPKTCKVT